MALLSAQGMDVPARPVAGRPLSLWPSGARSNRLRCRILHLYGLMDGTDDVLDGDPDVVVCVDEFGPLNLQPHPGGSG